MATSEDLQAQKELLWIEYRDKHVEEFFSKVPRTDILDNRRYTGIKVVHLCQNCQSYKASMNMLKERFSKALIAKLRERFRSYYYRKKLHKKTLSINEDTHTLLTHLIKEYEAESVDEMFEYLLSPKYNQMTEEALIGLGESHTASRLGENRALANLRTRLTKRDRESLDAILEIVFLEGWKKAKASRSKNINASQDAFEQTSYCHR